MECKSTSDIQAVIVKHDYKVYAIFMMKVSEYEHIKDGSYRFKAVIGFDGVDFDKKVLNHICGGSGPRVNLATVIRKTATALQMERIVKDGLVIHYTDIADGIPKTPKEQELELIAHLRMLKIKSPTMYEAALKVINEG